MTDLETAIMIKNMARETVRRMTAKNGPSSLVEEYRGYKIYFTNSSYNAPSLKLYGFSSEAQIKRAIEKELLKKDAAAKNAGLSVKRDFTWPRSKR